MAVIVWQRARFTAETETHLRLIKHRQGRDFYQLRLISTAHTPGIPIALDQGATYRELTFTRRAFNPPIPKSLDSIGESALDYLINTVNTNGHVIIYPMDSSEQYPDGNMVPQLVEALPGASYVYPNNTPNGFDIRIFYDASPIPRGRHFYLRKRIQDVSSSTNKANTLGEIFLKYGTRYVGEDASGNLMMVPRYVILFHEILHAQFYHIFQTLIRSDLYTIGGFHHHVENTILQIEDNFRASKNLTPRNVQVNVAGQNPGVCSFLHHQNYGSCPPESL